MFLKIYSMKKKLKNIKIFYDLEKLWEIFNSFYGSFVLLDKIGYLMKNGRPQNYLNKKFTFWFIFKSLKIYYLY